MKFYEMLTSAERLLSTTDDDGVITEEAFAQLMALQMDATEKAEYIAVKVKEEAALVEAIKNEVKNLHERAEVHQKNVDRSKGYLDALMRFIGKEKLETARCKLSYRKSAKVVIDDDAAIDAKYFVYKDPTISLSAIKDDIKAGVEVKGAHIEERQNLQIK